MFVPIVGGFVVVAVVALAGVVAYAGLGALARHLGS